MGYNLTIGEAYMDYDKKYADLSIRAEHAEREDAPDHDPYVQKGNSRSPSYTVWDEFCREAGEDVYAMFYGSGWSPEMRGYKAMPEYFIRKYPKRERPILAEHPGHSVLTKDDLKIVREALANRKKLGTIPGFNGVDDGVLARLLWLDFWIDWALKNCKIPILHNS